MPTDDSFAAFWALYPRKVAKLAALKAWRKVATSEALVEQIMAGLRAQLQTKAMQANSMGDKSFIPYPATWLNQRRFEDEPESCNKITKSRPRGIACPKCGDTGVINRASRRIEEGWNIMSGYLVRCSCAAGQLPGLMTGPIHAEDAL